MEIPILINHEIDMPIGVVKEQNGKLFFEFNADQKITKERAFDILGGAGLEVLEAFEEDGIIYYRKGIIREFSFCAPPPAINANQRQA